MKCIEYVNAWDMFRNDCIIMAWNQQRGKCKYNLKK